MAKAAKNTEATTEDQQIKNPEEQLDAAYGEIAAAYIGESALAPGAAVPDPYAGWNAAPVGGEGLASELELASEFGDEVLEGVHELKWDIELTNKGHYQAEIVDARVGYSNKSNRQVTVTGVVVQAIDPEQVGCAVRVYLPLPEKSALATDKQKLARFLRLAKLAGLADLHPNGTVKGFKKGAKTRDLVGKLVWFQAGLDAKDKDDPTAGYWNRVEKFLSPEEVVGY